ncbi:MAG: hypothetical protein GQF41_0325 [Candidatus Rifleibacterium amylolyticum]|nr:MAG: hypothetical protein GQF41_0325 [Candidatus Rifleibacterium amylolyticum]
MTVTQCSACNRHRDGMICVFTKREILSTDYADFTDGIYRLEFTEDSSRGLSRHFEMDSAISPAGFAQNDAVSPNYLLRLGDSA